MAKEVEILHKFMRMIDINPDKAYYGYNHVCKANEEMAIESLLITDSLFLSNDVATRKKYVNLVESVRDNGGKVYNFSTLHVSGVQLQQVSGIAAILRFPLPDLEALEEAAAEFDDDDDDDSSIDNDKQRFINAKEKEMDRIKEDMDDMGLSV